MKKLFFTTSMLLSIAAYSQVGINTQTPKGTLDVTAKKTDGTTAEGLIAPRLTGDQIKAADAQYGTDQKGTIVYATAAVGTSSTKTANITSEGYYYFDGSLWQKISSATAASGWGLTGNSGTTASTAAIGTDVNNNFIGTTDAQDLVLAANKREAARITSTGNVGIGISTPSAKLEIKSGTAEKSGLKFSDMNSSSAPTPDVATLGVDATGNVVIQNKIPPITLFRSFSIDANVATNSLIKIGTLEFRYSAGCTASPTYIQVRSTSGAVNRGVYHHAYTTQQPLASFPEGSQLQNAGPVNIGTTFQNLGNGVNCVQDGSLVFTFFSYTDRTFYRVNFHIADGDSLGFGAQGYIYVEYQK